MSPHALLFLPVAPKAGSTCPVFDLLARLSGIHQERGQLTSLAGVLIPSRWAGGLHQGPATQNATTLVSLTVCSCVCDNALSLGSFLLHSSLLLTSSLPQSTPLCLSGSFSQLSVLLGLEARTMIKLGRLQRNSFFTISQPSHSIPAQPKHVPQLPSLMATLWSFPTIICQGWPARASPNIERPGGGPGKVPASSAAGVRWIWGRASNTTDAPHERESFPRPSCRKQRMTMTSCSDARLEWVTPKNCLGSGQSSFCSTLQ